MVFSSTAVALMQHLSPFNKVFHLYISHCFFPLQLVVCDLEKYGYLSQEKHTGSVYATWGCRILSTSAFKGTR